MRDSSTSLGMTKRLRSFQQAPPHSKANPVARCRFGAYLFRREEIGRFGFSRDSRAHGAWIFRWRLQRPDPRADQTDAARRSLFGFTLRQDSPAILGPF